MVNQPATAGSTASTTQSTQPYYVSTYSPLQVQSNNQQQSSYTTSSYFPSPKNMPQGK